MVKKKLACDVICPLCFHNYETTDHLLVECNYSEVLWGIIAWKFNLPSYGSLIAKGRIKACVNHFANEGNKQN
jgi:hypothetical protein